MSTFLVLSLYLAEVDLLGERWSAYVFHVISVTLGISFCFRGEDFCSD